MSQVSKNKFVLVMLVLLFIGAIKLLSRDGLVGTLGSVALFEGEYCTKLGEIELRLEFLAMGDVRFYMQGEAGKLSVKVKERIIDDDFYLQAPPLNYSDNFDNYYSKIRPILYEFSGEVRAFRYHDMIYDRKACGDTDE